MSPLFEANVGSVNPMTARMQVIDNVANNFFMLKNLIELLFKSKFNNHNNFGYMGGSKIYLLNGKNILLRMCKVRIEKLKDVYLSIRLIEKPFLFYDLN